MRIYLFTDADYDTLAPWFDDEDAIRWMKGRGGLDSMLRTPVRARGRILP